MSDLESIKDKIKKVLALAKAGSDGEKQAAQHKLEVLLAKYDLTMDDITDERETVVFFSFSNKWEKRLLHQIWAMFNDDVDFDCWNKNNKNGTKVSNVVGFNCTALDAADIRAAFNHYRKPLEQTFETAMSGFVHKHQIFPTTRKGGGTQLSHAEMADLMAAMRMAKGQSWDRPVAKLGTKETIS